MDANTVTEKSTSLTYEWRINTVDSCLNEKGKVSSGYFTTGDHIWYLELSIDDSAEKPSDKNCHIKLFKSSHGVIDKLNKMAYITCAFMNDSGVILEFSTVMYEFNNSLDLMCTNRIKIPLSSFISNKSPMVICCIQLLKDFADLLNSTVFTDVKFLIGNKEIRAHTTVLISRNEVFRNMLYNLNKEGKNCIEITDIDYDAFEGLLQYIYTGVVIHLDQLATKLLHASQIYELDHLFDMCVTALQKNINIQNAGEILALAVRYDLDDLFEHVQTFISENIPAVTSSPEYENWICKYPDVKDVLEDLVF